MSEDNQSEKVLPGTGCGGCGCIFVIIAVIAAFAAGVIYSEQAKEKFDDIKSRFGVDVEEKIDEIKDKVEDKIQESVR